MRARASSSLSPALFPFAVILELLHPAVIRIHDIHRIVAIDKQARRQVELAQLRSIIPEVIQQVALPVEHLHYAPSRIDHIQVAFTVKADSLGPEEASHIVSNTADRILKAAAAVKHLH